MKMITRIVEESKRDARRYFHKRCQKKIEQLERKRLKCQAPRFLGTRIGINKRQFCNYFAGRIEQEQSIQTFLLLSTETNLCLAEMFLQKAHATARAKHAKLLYMLKSGSFANKQEKNQLNKKLVYYSSELDLYQEALRSLY